MPAAYEGTDIIMSEANNKVPGHPLEIFDFVSGSGSYIMLAKQVYHTVTPHIISRKRYIVKIQAIVELLLGVRYNKLTDKLEFTEQSINALLGFYLRRNKKKRTL